jgi:Uma2 family endonuclease
MPETVPLHEIDKLTYEDYALIPDDGRRHEILDGDHVMSPAPRTKHQRVVGALYADLYRHVRDHGLGEVFVAPFDVLLTEHDIVQPDLCFVPVDRRMIVNEMNCEGVPTLMVEVISPSTRRRDLVDKRKLYERRGVAEYWVADPAVDSVQVFRPDADGRYARVAELTAEAEDVLTSPLFPDWRLALADLF